MHDDDKQYLADHYYDYLSMARTLLRNDEEAKDAVQEALAATMASLWVTNVHSYCCKVLRLSLAPLANLCPAILC